MNLYVKLSVKKLNNKLSMILFILLQIHFIMEQANIVLERAKDYLRLPDWALVSENEHTTVSKLSYSDISAFSCYRLVAIIPKSKDHLVDKVWNVTESIVKSNDSEIDSWIELESDFNWKVCQQFNSMPWPLYQRELLFGQAKIEDGHTTWLVASSIDDHPKKSVTPSRCERAKIHMSIWGFTPIGENSTQVTRIVHVEPGGWIPELVVNATIGKHVTIIEKLGE
jgi:hypothetical protein